METIGVVIPTYNRKECLQRLLELLEAQVPGNFDMFIVVVVDGSTDGTLEMLETRFPSSHIVRGDGEWWWTRSVNQGCKHAVQEGADAVLLMNDDTEIEENFVTSLVEKNREQPGAVIGSLNLTIEEPFRMYFSGVKKITWWNARSIRYFNVFEPYKEKLTGLHKSVILMGRGLFIPVSVFDKTGFFDEAAFPQYKADVDFVLTAQKNNINTFISWDSVVYSHMALTGKGVTYAHQGFCSFLISFFRKNTSNNLVHSFRYYKKHCPWYLLPLSYFMDKLRLIYSYWDKRKFSAGFRNPGK